MNPRASFSVLVVAVLCSGAVFVGRDASVTFQSLTPSGNSIDILRNPQMPPPYDKTWSVATYFNNNGAYYSDAWMVISGRHEDEPDASGHYRIKNPYEGNSMVAVWSDIEGPAMVLRGNDLLGSYAFSVIDDATAMESVHITNDGIVECKSIKTKDGVSGVYRIGPAVVTLKGGRIMKVEGVKAF
jgi:hypothetical protein